MISNPMQIAEQLGLPSVLAVLLLPGLLTGLALFLQAIANWLYDTNS